MAVPRRLAWAVELLDVRPGDRILEIGCGPGLAVPLVCARLDGGHLTAIDRSPTAIERARHRNAEHVAAGKARFVCLDLAAAGELGERYDKVFAVNVNLFWARRPDAELQVVRGLLAADATLSLVFESPPGGSVERAASTTAATLAAHGFAVMTTSRSGSLARVSAAVPR
jgi:cyclopropane fatty-acyl-phospholipid synthase-like methyltransferase